MPSGSAGFYREMLKAFARQGYKRGDGETPNEFARRLETALGRSDEVGSVKNCLNFLTNLFYEVRFRGTGFNPSRSAEIESSLKELKKLLPAIK